MQIILERTASRHLRWSWCALALALVLWACGESGDATQAPGGRVETDAVAAPDAAPAVDARVDEDATERPDTTRRVDAGPSPSADAAVGGADAQGGAPDALAPPPDAVEREIGPAGGVLTFGGVRLVVPPRALVEVRRLRISYARGPAPEGHVLRSPVYRFEPVGTRFAVPASLTMAFEGPATGVSLFWSRAEGDGYEPIAGTAEREGLRGPVEHFSEGFVAEYVVDDCPDDPGKTAPGTCGCGTPDDDTDDDGDADCVDGCPDDADRQTPNDCGDCAPAPVERCDGLDDDCDGTVDEGFAVGRPCEAGVGACRAGGQITCAADGSAACGGVAGAPTDERCDAVDNDCDGTTDEGFDLGAACFAGVGQCRRQGVVTCAAGGLSGCNAVAVAPGVERCNDRDDDCDGETDEPDARGAPLWYRDADGDGHGDPADASAACDAPEGRVAAPDDCDDAASDVHPGAVEVCNERDDNCDGLTDENLADVDSDGVPDCRDGCPENREKTAPGACGCDAVESSAGADASPACRLPDPTAAVSYNRPTSLNVVKANPVTGTVLVGGDLTAVGHALGQAAIFDRAGALVPGTARIDGSVGAVVPDGAGGWFAGGAFSTVGGRPRPRLVHLLADGSPDPRWSRDVRVMGSVNALVRDPARGRLIVGGAFEAVGPWTGAAVRVDARTGARIETATGLGAHRISGMVMDALPDGTGGWFVAGLEAAGPLWRTHIARLLPDGRPDPTWDAGVEGIEVRDIELVDGVLYLVGVFNRVGGAPRLNAAAVEAASGRVLPWNPTVQGEVVALAVTPGAVFLAGDFSHVGGQPRARLAAVDRDGGALLPGLLDADDDVSALAASDGAVFVGGKFRTLAGQPRAGLASIDAATASLTAWVPPMRRTAGRDLIPWIKALAAGRSVLYVVGNFDAVGDARREGACAFETVTGALTPWDQDIDGRGLPRIRIVGERLFASPYTGRNFVVDLNPDDALPPLELDIPGQMHAVAAWGDELLIGGSFETFAPERRGNIAAFDLRTGALTDFDPGADGVVHALALDGDRLYVGGSFSAFGGQPRANAAAADASTGAPLEWAPEPDDAVLALGVFGGTVYLGGTGTNVRGRSWNWGLAAVDAQTGRVTPFDAGLGIGSDVSAILVSQGVVFAGGSLDESHGAPLSNVGAFDPVTGALLWGPPAQGSPPGAVTALARADDTLFVGHEYGLRVLDIATGQPRGWPSQVGGRVETVAVDGDHVFVGGAFTVTGVGGPAALVSGRTGALLRSVPTHPEVRSVLAAAVDSAGRWYLASQRLPRSGIHTYVEFTRTNPDGTPDPTWRTEVVAAESARVNAMLVDEPRGRLLIAGEFAGLGTRTGGGALIDPRTGALIGPDATDRFDGRVLVTRPDGAGGWYVGGDFVAVGDRPLRYLVRVRADGTVDPAWTPSPDEPVRSMALADGVLYVGGMFTEIAGAARERLAALDPATGAALPWNPGADGPIDTLAVDGGVVFAGGLFSRAGDQPRNRLAGIDTVTGEVTPWDPDANGAVRTLAIADGIVYVAGGAGVGPATGFTRVGGLARATLAAIDASTGEVTPWDPAPTGRPVNTLAVWAGTVYLGGEFSRIGGQDRVLLAAVDAATAAVTNWNPGPQAHAPGLGVFAIDVVDGIVYVGGSGFWVGATRRNRAAAFDASTGEATAWSLEAFWNVESLSATGGGVFLGGSFESPGERTETFTLSLDLGTGDVRAWRPQLDGRVTDIEVAGDTAVVCGASLALGRSSGVQALDADTGAFMWPERLPSWPLEPFNVHSLAVWAGVVYLQDGLSWRDARGQFQRGMGLDLATGAPTPWAPRFTKANNGEPQNGAIAASDGLIYVSGDFDAVDGQPRAGLAVVDAATGAVMDWAPADRGGGLLEIITGRVHTGGAVYCTTTPCTP